MFEAMDDELGHRSQLHIPQPTSHFHSHTRLILDIGEVHTNHSITALGLPLLIRTGIGGRDGVSKNLWG